MILYIANRGEIARRVIRTARRMQIRTVVGFADGDRDLPFVAEADEAYPLHGVEPGETYLNIEKVLSLVRKVKATHIHPGYGFLSENADCVEAVTMEGIEWVGPSAESMRLLGDKIGSRRFLKEHGISLLPCYEGDDQSSDRLLMEAKHLGFPLLIKPSAGGGGKGMLRVDGLGDFRDKLESSKRVAKAAFRDDRVFLERLVERARHVEVQIIADTHGHVRVLGERECSLQRRHQKVIEEAPCIFLPAALRQKIYEMSERIARAAKYTSAGTVEWIWDGADGIYFLEVNARIQVEHPVTEAITGVDIVECQLRVARGESLAESADAAPVPSADGRMPAHAIEARLCAEDPARDFLPTGGKIVKLVLPETSPKHLRIDLGYREGNTIPSVFDSLIGKIIATGNSRAEAIENLRQALERLWLAGPKTNRAYLIQLLHCEAFQKGELTTDLLSKLPYRFDLARALSDLQAAPVDAAQAVDEDADLYSPWGRPRASIGPTSESLGAVEFEDRGELRHIHTRFDDWSIARPRAQGRAAVVSDAANPNEIRSPMPGKVLRILTVAGESVEKGRPLLLLEAMKMEHQMKAPRRGKVKKIHFKEGDRVAVDALLLELES